MASIPLSEAELVEQARAFATSIEPQRARWEYCFGASHYKYRTRAGNIELVPNHKSIATCARILGRRKFWAERGLRQMRRLGYEAAQVDDADYRVHYPGTSLPGTFDVGPLSAWGMGHVYFARVADFPHVVKIGFSRRVHERLDDIESSTKARLIVRPGELKVGTLLNEHWWHRNWQATNIAGEWFFDPFVSERTMPAFLQQMAEAS